jgi:hypothetical protein
MTIHEINEHQAKMALAFAFAKGNMGLAEPLDIRSSSDDVVIQYRMDGFQKLVNGNTVCVEFSNLDELAFVHLKTPVMDGVFITSCQTVDAVPEEIKEKYGLN